MSIYRFQDVCCGFVDEPIMDHVRFFSTFNVIYCNKILIEKKESKKNTLVAKPFIMGNSHKASNNNSRTSGQYSDITRNRMSL